MSKPIRGISLFSGAGGLDIGFERAGCEILFATDIDAICCNTLRANAGNTLSSKMNVVQGDIWELDLDSLPTDIDFVVGGPPCQSFSASGRRAGGAPGGLDKRGTLFQAYCRVLEKTRPLVFLFENVRGILGTNNGKDFQKIVSAFSDLGYTVSYRILDAEDYGVPQQRERLFVVGHKLDEEFQFPQPLFGPDSKDKPPYISVKQATEDLVLSEEEEKQTIFNGGKYVDLLPLVPPGSNYLHFTAKRGCENPVFAYRSRFSDFLYKANPETPTKTLIASPGKYTGPLHWENRYLTVREYMRIQGFPDHHILCGKRSDMLRQIGNSVCPKVAYSMALAIKKQIFGVDAELSLIDSSVSLTFDKRKGQKARKTKEIHDKVANAGMVSASVPFNLFCYRSYASPSSFPEKDNIVVDKISETEALMNVFSDTSNELQNRLHLIINDSLSMNRDLHLYVNVFGESPHGVQTMWNAVDDWVRKSSSYRSLIELYGHFTEPHPIFRIGAAETYSELPICKFAIHYTNFSNCSVYFQKDQLLSLWRNAFGINDFGTLAKELRNYRFDIRCHETNITIPNDVFMVAYPFTLPYDKQMNFAVKEN